MSMQHNERERLLSLTPITAEPPAKKSVDFKYLHKTLKFLHNHEEFNLTQCPTLNDALSSIPILMDQYFTKFSSALCVHFKISESFMQLNELQFKSFYDCIKLCHEAFLIILESLESHSGLIYWRLKNEMQIFALKVDFVGLCDFLKMFLIEALKDGQNGINISNEYLDNQILIDVALDMLCDSRGYNLLFKAVEIGNVKLARMLVNFLDAKKVINREIVAVDLAMSYETVLVLLLANSRFPHNFKYLQNVIPENLKNFIADMEKFHEAISSEDLEVVNELIGKYPGLNYFFNVKNESALKVAMTKGSFEVYKILMKKNFSLGLHEDLNDILNRLNFEVKKKLSEINADGFVPITEKYISTLTKNVIVGQDDNERQTRLTLVSWALQRLSSIEVVKLLLEIVAATNKFELIFDFNRDHVRFLDPKAGENTNGLYYLKGKILIGAKHLLDPSRAHEVLGVIAHEFCHFVMNKIFGNLANPYEKDDIRSKQEFQNVLKICKGLYGMEKIVDYVFDCYPEHYQHAELIVRYPHMLAHYIDQPDQIERIKIIFSELIDYFNLKCLPLMEQVLPEITAEHQKEIAKEHTKLKKKQIKRLQVIVGALIFAFILTGITAAYLSSCDCGGDPHCRTQFGSLKCSCRHNLIWLNNKCQHCSKSPENHYTCSEELYQCNQDSIEYVKLHSVCDNVNDCSDKSDENSCVHGSNYTETGFFTFSVVVENNIIHDNYRILSEFSNKIERFVMRDKKDVNYLPIDVSKKFPNLRIYDASTCLIKRVFKKNFHDLNNLERILLSSNVIEFIENDSFLLPQLKTLDLANNRLTSLKDNIFKELTSLQFLKLNSNRIRNVSSEVFTNLKSLLRLDLSNNHIESLSVNIFATLKSLERIDLSLNLLKILPGEIFGLTHTKLTHLNLSSNKIVNGNASFIYKLDLLMDIDLRNNPCINLNYTGNIPIGKEKRKRLNNDFHDMCKGFRVS